MLILILIACFIVIFVQDYKDRLVNWVLYLAVAVFSYWINIDKAGLKLATINSLINLSFIFLILVVVLIYVRYFLNKKLNETLGIGDIMLFIGISFTFSSISFIVLFTFSLLFSFIIDVIMKNMTLNNTEKSVPLAGYISIFFAFIYVIVLFGEHNFLFAY